MLLQSSNYFLCPHTLSTISPISQLSLHPPNTSHPFTRTPHRQHTLSKTATLHTRIPPGNTPSNRLPDQYTLTPIANSTPGSVKNRESVDISGISSIQTAPKKCDFFKIEKGMYQGGNFRDFLQFFGALFQQSVWVESHSGNCSGVRIQIQVLSISPLWLHWKAEQRAEVSLIRNAASSTS